MCLFFSFSLASSGGLDKSWDGGCLFPDSHSTPLHSRTRNQPLRAWGPLNLCSVSWCVWEAPSPRNRASVIWHVCYPTIPSKPKPFEQWSYRHLGFQPPQGTWEELVPCVRGPSFMETSLCCTKPGMELLLSHGDKSQFVTAARNAAPQDLAWGSLPQKHLPAWGAPEGVASGRGQGWLSKLHTLVWITGPGRSSSQPSLLVLI